MTKTHRWLLLLLLLSPRLPAENVDTTFAERMDDHVAPAPVPLRVVHPREGMSLPSLRSSFSYGWADPSGTLSINGNPVRIHPGGGWLAMVSYAPGLNTLRYSYENANGTLAVDRVVSVGGGGGGPMTGLESVKPDQDLGVLPGETVTVSFRGPSGGRASFHVPGVRGKFKMSEVSGTGTYRGFFTAPSGTVARDARIKIAFESKNGKDLSRNAPGRLTILDPESPWLVEVSTDVSTLRAGPGFTVKDTAGYVMFPPMGVRLRATGFRGDELRVRVTRDRDLWIARNEVQDLPKGTSIPQAVTYGVTVLPGAGSHGLVRMAITQKVPFEITSSADQHRVDVRFFGAYSNTDWIHLSKDVPWIRQARWVQETSEVFLLSVETDKVWWGFDARYEGSNFVLELRRPPRLANPKYPLEGLTIAVDAGHSADNGAVGITGTFEKDLNLAIAECLKSKLEKDKAQVVMIREGTSHVPLYDRPKLAWAAKADILVSVHNNALPEGEDPFEKNGFGVYYYHPHSLAFAQDVHRAYQDRFLTGRNALGARMKDDGLHWGNLALPRTTQMPAILTESAYMIYPEEEWWLRQPSFQCDCAEAMRVGLKRYTQKARPR